MVDTTIMGEVQEMIDNQKLMEEKEKKRAYMREYMRKYHATKKAEDAEYVEKYRAQQRKANAKRRQRDEVKEADRAYYKKWSAERTKKLELLKQFEDKILDMQKC